MLPKLPKNKANSKSPPHKSRESIDTNGLDLQVKIRKKNKSHSRKLED